MKSEFNDYKITNGDGRIKCNNEGKIRYDNDDSHFIKENSLSNQDENLKENESFGLEKKDKVENQKTSNDINKTTNSTPTATTSAATSTAASSTSAISSSLGSLIGGVVSSIATAVMVVVAFVSVMTINISLVMAGANILVFQVEINNAQKEDFENPIYAILEGDEYSQTQEIFADSVYITFEDLEAGKEYKITIRNDEKVFVEKSYLTATNDIQRGFIEAWNEEGTVYALVNVRELKSNEYYTFTVTNGQGMVLFENSDVEQEKEYSFDIESSDVLTFTLAINEKICCFEQLSVEFEPGDHEHNYSPRGFVWSYDETDGWIAIGEGVCEDCEDVLTIPAEMSRDGDVIIATITYNGTTYTDSHVEIDLTGKENIISDDNCYYLKARSFVLGNLDSGTSISCTNDENHPYTIKGTADQILNSMIVYNRFITKSDYYIEFDNLNIVADEENNSTILNVQTASNVTIHIAIRGNVSLTTNGSHCFNVENTGRDSDITVTFDITFIDNRSSFSCYDELLEKMNLYNPQSEANIIFNINGVQVDPNGETISQEETTSYDFTQGSWFWADDYLTASISFPEIHGGEPLTYEAFVQEYETPATCEEMGSIVYTASIYIEEADEMFSDEQTVDIEPTGHDYGEPVFEWSQNITGAPSATATFTCLNDSTHTFTLEAEVSESYSQNQTLQYIATVTYNDVTYQDIYEDSPIAEEGVEINLNEGQLYINANGYARQESGLSNPVEFVSSADNPYLIEEQEIYGCDNIINVYQTDSSIQTADIYIKLKNVTIEADSWCSLFRIMATNTLNIHLIIEGNVHFTGGDGQQVFSSQGSNSPTVNIIIDQTSFGGTFDVDTPDGLTYAQSGTINVRYV